MPGHYILSSIAPLILPNQYALRKSTPDKLIVLVVPRYVFGISFHWTLDGLRSISGYVFSDRVRG